MGRTSAWRSACLAALVALAGCNEQLTIPGRCPALCPATQVQLADTLLAAADSADTTARGYVQVSEAWYVAASSLDSLKSVILLRFSREPDRWAQTTSDTVLAAFPPDSVHCTLQPVWRDSTVHPRLVFYRLPARFDTTMTYAQVQPYLADSTVLDTAAVPDTGFMEFRMPASVLPAPADSGVVALAVKVVADAPTVVAFTSGVGLAAASTSLTFFVHGQSPRDSLTRTLQSVTDFATFVQSPEPGIPPPGVLAIGGLPSAHTLLRLALPKVAVDSVGIVRATLQLSPVRPVVTFPRDSFYIEAFPLLRDNGPKSVLVPDTSAVGRAVVHEGQTGTVNLDIAPILRLWGTTLGDSLPRTIVLSVGAEANAFGELDFRGRGGPGAPQLRVTYVKSYPSGVP